MTALEILLDTPEEEPRKLKKKTGSLQAAKDLCYSLRRAGFYAYVRHSVVFIVTAIGIDLLTALDGWVLC